MTPKLGSAPHSHTVFGGTIFASPFHMGVYCQHYDPPQKKTPTILFISYFSKNKTKQNINKNDKKGGGKKRTMTKEFCMKSKHSGGKY